MGVADTLPGDIRTGLVRVSTLRVLPLVSSPEPTAAGAVRSYETLVPLGDEVDVPESGRGTYDDRAWWSDADAGKTWLRESAYVPGPPDLALDVYRPRDSMPHPTIIVSTRYFRRSRYRPGAAPFETLFGRQQEALFFVDAGYAYVVVDTRGSGASFGYRTSEFSADEVADGTRICDWIVQQPWSSGVLGTTGVSYEGIAAEHLLRTGHPALKAAAVRYGLFDAYADIVFPGGLRNRWFLDIWSRMTAAMDRNELEEFLFSLSDSPTTHLLASLTDGVAPVDDDDRLAQAIREHAANYSLDEMLRSLEFSDDARCDGLTLGDLSPVTFLDDLVSSGVAVYSWAGWYDGAYADAAIKRWLAMGAERCRLILGPWDHGNSQVVDPLSERTIPSFDHLGELRRFFDHHLKGVETGIEAEPPVHYFTVGDGWHGSSDWPPAGLELVRYYLGDAGQLSLDQPVEPATDVYEVVPSSTSGSTTRWQTQANLTGAQIGWPDRKLADAELLVYETRPLDRDVVLTGNPVLGLWLSADREDTAIHAYLEEVGRDHDVRYVTEGVFRAVHRRLAEEPPRWLQHLPYHTFRRGDAEPLVPGEAAELRFHLFAISYRFQRGSRIRLALAGADRDTFALAPATGGTPTWQVHRSPGQSSWLDLPLRIAE